MGEQTGIEWCHHTFNPWRGCTKLSAGCAHCYAETLSHRNPKVLGVWGDQGTRPEASDAYWLQALAWYKAAIKAGEVRRVFCGSLMDVGEDRPELDPLRDRLMALIALTPFLRSTGNGRRSGLHWLLLTKRPAALRRYLEDPGLYDRVLEAARWWRSKQPKLYGVPISDPGRASAAWYPQLAIGVSVENQAAADERIPELLRVPARVRFLSMEPLLGEVDLSRHLHHDPCPRSPDETGLKWASFGCGGCSDRIQWIIAGGESGPKARPMHPEWARSLRDQAVAAGVPFLFKQWGEYAPAERYFIQDDLYDVPNGTLIEEGADGLPLMLRVGKKAAGRGLDGRTWDEVPSV